MTTEEMQAKIEASMPSNKDILKMMDTSLKRQKRNIIIKAIGLVLTLLFQIFILGAVVWLLFKQCS